MILLFGLVLSPVEVMSASPEECKSHWEVSAFDILKMSDKALLDMFCDTNKKLDYNIKEGKKALSNGNARSFVSANENCLYISNLLYEAVKGRLKVYKSSDLQCLE